MSATTATTTMVAKSSPSASPAIAAVKPVVATKKSFVQTMKPFVCGGLGGCCAVAVMQPVDMVKVRIQLTGEAGSATVRNPFVIGRQVIRESGVRGLYKGLSAGFLRQLTYTTTRMGLFRTFSNALSTPGEPLALWKSALCGLASGGLGAVVGTPSDLILIRFQADGTLPVAQRRNYKGLTNALVRITREEGVAGLFTGCAPVVYRAMALNMGMLASYDHAKHAIAQRFGPGYKTNFAASAVGGFFGAMFCIPFDFIKTRIQKQKRLPDGTLPYRNTWHAFRTVFKQEGPFAVYKGFATFYMRVAPVSMITLFMTDVFAASWNKYVTM